MGLLPRSISVQKLKNPWLRTLVLERRGRELRDRGREVAPGTRERWFYSGKAQGREERGERVFKVPTQGSKIPLDSN